ncbi:MAG TPA: DUF6580 family putative transport protein [Candidatus Saccharimonadia bacterium]|nr:DUF6580 family putative transport protein [Candidatus Saccharimonadia bacterium]
MKRFSATWLVAAGLIATAVVWRLVNWQYSIAPNLEIVTASALVAAAFLGRRTAVVVPLAIMAVSDILIGNSNILLFTWSAFALIGLAGLVLRRFTGRPARLLAASVGMAVGGSVFFFVWTNFGVWLLGDGTLYAKTWAGLTECYVAGLPFYRTMLVGNLVLVPAYMGTALMIARLRAAQLETGWSAKRS